MIAATLLLIGGVTVTLPARAEIRGTEIQLGAIAEVTGEDAGEVARIQSVMLGYAPSPGYSRLVRDYDVRTAVQRVAATVDVEVVGERACRVWPRVETVTADRLVAAAREEVVKLVGASDVEYEAVGDVQPLQVPEGDRPAEVRAKLAGESLRPGVLAVPVEVLVDGTSYRTVWTSWRLTLFEKVPVLARPIVSGEPIGLGALQRKRVEVGQAGSGKALSESLLVGAVAARDLEAGAIVTALDVHRPTVVNSGDNVMLQVRKGAVTARVTATAREAGSVGDRIRVEAGGTGSVLSAVVLSRELCEIVLTAGHRSY